MHVNIAVDESVRKVVSVVSSIRLSTNINAGWRAVADVGSLAIYHQMISRSTASLEALSISLIKWASNR